MHTVCMMEHALPCLSSPPVYLIFSQIDLSLRPETSRVTPRGLSVVGNFLLTAHFSLNTIQI